MRKDYQTPSVEVTAIEIEGAILQGSGGSLDSTPNGALDDIQNAGSLW